MDNNELNLGVGKSDDVKKLDSNELDGVSGGYQEYIHIKGWKKTYCDRCDQQITGPEQIGLSSPDKKHHICKSCVATLQQLIPNRMEYYKYLKDNFGIDLV